MKYFTKEFYISEFLSYASKTVKKRKRAAVADEQFFLEMYKKNCDLFLKNENLSDFYKDPVEQLNRIEQYINAPDISEEEKERRLFFKETFLALNEDRIKRGKVYKFDKELHERKFNEIYKQSLEYYSHLPAEILNKIER